jgi:hypothetical protein
LEIELIERFIFLDFTHVLPIYLDYTANAIPQIISICGIVGKEKISIIEVDTVFIKKRSLLYEPTL